VVINNNLSDWGDTACMHCMQEDNVVEHHRKQKLAQYDRFFRRFEYSKALDAAMMVKFGNLCTFKVVDVMHIIFCGILSLFTRVIIT